MARRAWGSGSLYQRESDGRWIGSAVDSDGNRHYVTGTARDQVRHRLTDLKRELRSTTSPATAETVADFLSRWLDDVAGPRVRPRTIRGYRRLVHDHVVPEVGDIPLASLGPDDVQRMVNAVRRKRSAQTTRNAHAVLRAALSDAVRLELVGRNVAQLVRPPKPGRSQEEPLPLDDARRIIAETTDDELHAFYVLAIATGMRQGEIMALRWQDFDKTRRTLSVNASLRRLDEHRWSRDEPKTRRSRRTLTLPRAATRAVKGHEKAHAHSAVFVFTRPDGRPYDAAVITRRFQAACKRLGLRKVTMHSLRHTAAALMLDGSAGDLRMVMSVLGHSNISTTVDLYGGLAEQARGRAAGVMDELLEKAPDASAAQQD